MGAIQQLNSDDFQILVGEEGRRIDDLICIRSQGELAVPLEISIYAADRVKACRQALAARCSVKLTSLSFACSVCTIPT